MNIEIRQLVRVCVYSFVLLRLNRRVSTIAPSEGTLWMSHSSTERSNPSYPAMPGYVKIIILAQAATILSFAVWMYQEYLNDIYFQEYVISLLRSNIIADSLLPIVTLSVFALGTFTLLGEMG